MASSVSGKLHCAARSSSVFSREKNRSGNFEELLAFFLQGKRNWIVSGCFCFISLQWRGAAANQLPDAVPEENQRRPSQALYGIYSKKSAVSVWQQKWAKL
jgi:hypothetical protein